MKRPLIAMCLLAACVIPTARAADKVTDVEPLKQLDPAHMKAVANAIGAKPGETRGKVHTITLPRDDLDVYTPDFADIPVEAGLASTFRFWRCTCGKYYMLGEFVVADYEANDVIDALRKDPDAGLRVTSIGPLLLNEKPRLIVVRFFGENRSAAALAKALRSALAWTGKERMAPRKVE